MNTRIETVDCLFCYGTLEYDEVMRAVTGRSYPSTDAILPDHARYVMRGEIYPGVIAEAGAQVHGTLYEGVDHDALQLLDHYESDDYRRCVRVVETGSRGAAHAWVYVVPEALRDHLGDRDWDPADFARHHLPSWLGRLRR